MVFFTSIIIVAIFYFLQSDGLIYITIIALVAEMMNIFLTHTLTKSVEEKMKDRHKRMVQGYLSRIKSNKRTIKELEKIQDEAASKLYKANEKIKSLEREIATLTEEEPSAHQIADQNPAAAHTEPTDSQTDDTKGDTEVKPPPKPADIRDHLPDGSGRNSPPV